MVPAKDIIQSGNTKITSDFTLFYVGRQCVLCSHSHSTIKSSTFFLVSELSDALLFPEPSVYVYGGLAYIILKLPMIFCFITMEYSRNHLYFMEFFIK